MKLVIRSVGTSAHPNLRTWEPDDREDIATIVIIEIGPRNGKGGDTFMLRLATPEGLRALNADDGVIASRGVLIVPGYDYPELSRWLERTVASCEADTWPQCVEKLRRWFRWEYDDYQE